MGPVYVINIVKDKGCMKWHPTGVLIESFRLKIVKTSVTLFGIFNPGCSVIILKKIIFSSFANSSTDITHFNQHARPGVTAYVGVDDKRMKYMYVKPSALSTNVFFNGINT